ncbi:beta-mannosidase [Natronoarchaeum philippinense]|uniref:beta-mannosidase n=1 Tax=Natronoarchaeum philippinense TaxID=558529 RepID=A0A285NS30_NATPI|nr:glycoside hydrolase family 2 [Natronoarchaeum philippinense]SNZ12285.1 beta-mannosidase [Natronoarchaeum philippinense]
MLDQWQGAAVEPSDDDEPPVLDDPDPVDIPGRPDALAGADAVAYRTTFPDPRDDEETRATLVLDGLYAHARVWHDGELLGEHDTYFRPARFEFEPSADNELIVECRRPDDGFGGVHETDRLPESARVPGIWWDAHVETHGPVALVDLSVTPRLDENRGTITAELTVDAAEQIDERATLSLRPEGFRGGGAMERVHVQADAGERVTVQREIEVREPRRWWPRDLGSQHRYTVRAKLDGAERAATTGFSTVSLDDDGLRINGRRARARGVNVVPSEDPVGAVEAAAAANANLVRAHAHVASPSFREACDEAGLLLWQDLPLSGPVDVDPERGAELADALVETTRASPSVGVYGVHDDPADPFEQPLGSGTIARSRLRWRAWRTDYDRSTADEIAATFDTDRPVVPVAGPPGTAPDAANLYPGWDYGVAADIDRLLDRYPGLGEVVSEFGAGSVVDPDGTDSVPGLADRIEANDPERTQREQARTVKRVGETLRRNGAAVVAAFALQDARPAGGMGLLAADGGEKPAYSALADAYEPLQAVLDDTPRPGTVGVTVVNDTGEHAEATVEWTAGDRGGSFDATVEPLDSESAGGVKIPDGADEVVLTLSNDGEGVTNTYRL